MQIIAASYLLPINGEPLQGGAVAVEDGVIRATGTLADLRRSFAAPVTEYPGCAIMPGLVNAHTHLELTHFPAWLYRKDLKYSPRTYVDWIIQVIKVKRGLQYEELAASLREGLDISLQAGTTMVGDILSDRRLLTSYADREIGGRIYLELIGQNRTLTRELLTDVLAAAEQVPSPFLPGLAPHAPFTVADGFLADITAAARSRRIPLTMHLAESKEESAFFLDTTGTIATDLYPFVQWEKHLPPPRRQTPTEWFHGTGLAGPDFHAVHCVHLTMSDADLVSRSGLPIVLCPRSNDKLDVGRAPVHLFRKAGIRLALGTDSLASNDSLSLWDEMRALLQFYPGEFTPAEVLEIATQGGAAAIGRGGEAGSLVTGKRADLLLLDLGKDPGTGKLHESILFNSRLTGVWVAGTQVVHPS
ncbi:MAG TPA: amidohydrolase family protein [Geobacteraceae bacterium]|nr:amidohydrolase family protein [Geobacteraceae bacterium]